MWNKIKEFCKKWWGLIFVPVGIFILHLFKKDNHKDYVEKELKEEKEVVEELSKEIVKTEEKVVSVEEAVEEITSDIKHTIENTLEDKKLRDEKAKEFFPGL